jgi:transposase-like protein
MSQSKATLKARMMREAETLIDQMLATKKPADQIMLSEIERAAVDLGNQFREAVAEELAADSQRETSVIPRCPSCGEPMKFKGYRTRQLETEAGGMELKRAYYYCAPCRQGIFPPG